MEQFRTCTQNKKVKILRSEKILIYFDPSSYNIIGEDEIVKILKGRVNNSEPDDSVYFLICKNDVPQLQESQEHLRVDNLEEAIKDVFNKSEWFGKFGVVGQSQIIVPWKYELLIKPSEKQLVLSPTEKARYYGSGNLQLDKDLSTKVIRTDIGLNQFKNIVNKTCSSYEAPFTKEKTLYKWN